MSRAGTLRGTGFRGKTPATQFRRLGGRKAPCLRPARSRVRQRQRQRDREKAPPAADGTDGPYPQLSATGLSARAVPGKAPCQECWLDGLAGRCRVLRRFPAAAVILRVQCPSAVVFCPGGSGARPFAGRPSPGRGLPFAGQLVLEAVPLPHANARRDRDPSRDVRQVSPLPACTEGKPEPDVRTPSASKPGPAREPGQGAGHRSLSRMEAAVARGCPGASVLTARQPGQTLHRGLLPPRTGPAMADAPEMQSAHQCRPLSAPRAQSERSRPIPGAPSAFAGPPGRAGATGASAGSGAAMGRRFPVRTGGTSRPPSSSFRRRLPFPWLRRPFPSPCPEGGAALPQTVTGTGSRHRPGHGGTARGKLSRPAQRAVRLRGRRLLHPWIRASRRAAGTLACRAAASGAAAGPHHRRICLAVRRRSGT